MIIPQPQKNKILQMKVPYCSEFYIGHVRDCPTKENILPFHCEPHGKKNAEKVNGKDTVFAGPSSAPSSYLVTSCVSYSDFFY